MNTHTPGKWKVSGSSIVTDDDALCIAVIEDDGGYEAQAEQQTANARLIAAAPDLLAALQTFVTLSHMLAFALTADQISEATVALTLHCHAARLALSKATGGKA